MQSTLPKAVIFVAQKTVRLIEVSLLKRVDLNVGDNSIA